MARPQGNLILLKKKGKEIMERCDVYVKARIELLNENGKVVIGRTMYGCDIKSMETSIWTIAKSQGIDTTDLALKVELLP
ncbi:MAG: hypothetical protein IKV80_07140 [Bacteroidales bacterium]|nr:hypothetical protein [Bacteroidales bacterium]